MRQDERALTLIEAPMRHIGATITYDDWSNHISHEFNCWDELVSVTIERVGDETKFFGYGVCQKINVHILDPERKYELSTNGYLALYLYEGDSFSSSESFYTSIPAFWVTEVHRDENTNELSITGYDILYETSKRYYSEVQELFVNEYTYDLRSGVYTLAEENATLRDYADACAQLFELALVYDEEDESLVNAFSIVGKPNLEGTETIREVLDDIAEATQTIYFVDSDNCLWFKRLNIDGEPDYHINKDMYIKLDSKTNRRLGALVSATSLGDNILVETSVAGTTQYIRDNAFWDLRDDREVVLEQALEAVGGLTINQFNCNWRGNFLLEIGDKLALTTKDDEVVYSYLLNDTIRYNGGYEQVTSWEYTNSDTEDMNNPSSLGDVLKKTYATVDKVNKEIDIVASLSKENEEAISSIKLTTDSIANSVESVESVINGLTQEIEELTRRVETIITPDMLQIQIQEALKDGITEVTTTTGFTFNEEGLNVAKTGSEMNTSITEDGMTVYREKTPMLVANNEGVEAINLKASTYLIIGLNSRFEDYDNKTRTGCFWIGG